jgi:hypothetical protein
LDRTNHFITKDEEEIDIFTHLFFKNMPTYTFSVENGKLC